MGPALSCPLCSLQGDRGFDGLAGLPGEKGHRVSVCCLGAAGSSHVRALRGSLRVPRGPDPRSQSGRYVSLMGVGPDMDRTSWGCELSPRRAHLSTAADDERATGVCPSRGQAAGSRLCSGASTLSGNPAAALRGPARTLRTIKGATPGCGPAPHGLPSGRRWGGGCGWARLTQLRCPRPMLPAAPWTVPA